MADDVPLNEVTITNRFVRWDTTKSAIGFVRLYEA